MMNRRLKLSWLPVLLLLLPIMSACGGGGSSPPPPIVGPGLVEIDDRPTVADTAPVLIVTYTLPGDLPGTPLRTAIILSDQPIDGDIAFDPVLGSTTITQGPDTLLFGIDSAAPNQPEYRAFLDFFLDSATSDSIPLTAIINTATLTFRVNFVDFAATVPVLVDLVQYSVQSGLTPEDFSTIPLAGLAAFNLLNTDAGQDVSIDVTTLMDAAQINALVDFQLRILLDLGR